MIRRVASALILGGAVASWADAQTAPVPATMPAAAVTPQPSIPFTAQAAGQPRPVLSDVPPPAPVPAVLTARPADQPQPAQNQPARAPRARDPLASQGRFANPGGVGKFSEYYTPFTPMYGYAAQPPRVGGFDRGGGPNRQEQIEAFRVGQFRTQNIQNNINAYGRPLGFGYGFGIGIGGYGGGYR